MDLWLQDSPDNMEELYAMLYADDLYGWTQTVSSRKRGLLDTWIRNNAVHAIESCPKVLTHWHISHPSFALGHVFHQYIGAALEALDDNVKAGILSGVYEGAAQKSLYEFIVQCPYYWESFSPSWIGPPGSALRAAAVERGWSNLRLMAQVTRESIARPEAERWSQWVPYVYSITILKRRAEVILEKKNRRTETDGLKPVERKAQAWSRPEDIALALSLLKSRPDYFYVLKPHQAATPITAALQERMDSLVSIHQGLGMMDTLQQMVIAGAFPDSDMQATMELPDMGISPF
jgi:hypothetical protein